MKKLGMVVTVMVVLLVATLIGTFLVYKYRRESFREMGLFTLRVLTSVNKNGGVKIMDEEWDYLIILDSCRYDTFKEIYPEYLVGELDKKKSLGSCTQEWFYRNFVGRECSDTIYISSNGWISEPLITGKMEIQGENIEYKKYVLGCNPFFKLHFTEQIHPGHVNQVVVTTVEVYPEKRMIIHYMQPHSPYILSDVGSEVWGGFASGKVSKERMLQLYEENLRFVLSHVVELLPKLRGTVVITSDHGNCFRDYMLCQHPCEIHLPNLVDVPWFTVEGNS